VSDAHEQARAGALVINSVSVAISGVLATSWLGWLPPTLALLASLFAIVWYAIQILESATVQNALHPAARKPLHTYDLDEEE
jgi:hypothetical protein